MRFIVLLIALLLALPAQPSKPGLGAAPTAAPAPQQGRTVDFSKMPVEDAIQMMFMLVSEDARKDMKGMLTDMEKDRNKKAALRDAEKNLKEQLKNERDALKRRRIEERLARLKAEREAAERRQQARLQRMRQRMEQERRREEARETRARKMEEERRRRQQERVERARQRHAGQQQGAKGQQIIQPQKPCPNANFDCHQFGALKNSTASQPKFKQ